MIEFKVKIFNCWCWESWILEKDIIFEFCNRSNSTIYQLTRYVGVFIKKTVKRLLNYYKLLVIMI